MAFAEIAVPSLSYKAAGRAATAPRLPLGPIAVVPRRKLPKAENFSAVRALLQGSSSQDAYCRSVLYYAFTGRGSVRVIGRGSDAVIAMLHPNRPRSLLVFFPFADNAQAFLRQVAQLVEYRDCLEQFDVFLARVPDEIVRQTFENRDKLFKSGWWLRKMTEETLDWVYPSYDVSLASLVASEGGALMTYRKKLRKFDAQGVRLVRLADAEAEDVEEAVKDVSRRWVETKCRQYKERPDKSPDLNDLLDPYSSLAALNAVSAPDLRIDGFVLKRGDEPLAFAFWQRPEAPTDTVACMAALPRSHELGLSEYLYFQIARTLVAQGYQRMCIGGSETPGLDHFKRKLAPVASHVLHTVEFHTS
jgi:hypothetical protein